MAEAASSGKFVVASSAVGRVTTAPSLGGKEELPGFKELPWLLFPDRDADWVVLLDFAGWLADG